MVPQGQGLFIASLKLWPWPSSPCPRLVPLLLKDRLLATVFYFSVFRITKVIFCSVLHQHQDDDGRRVDRHLQDDGGGDEHVVPAQPAEHRN